FLDLRLGEVLGGDAVEKPLELVDDLLLVYVLALELDRRLLDHRVGGVDRRVRANRDRDRIRRARVDLELGAVLLHSDRGIERVLAQLGHRHADDLDVELAEDVDEQVVREGARGRRALELHQDRRGLWMADPDRQELVRLGRLQEHDRLLADEIERDAVDDHLRHPGVEYPPTDGKTHRYTGPRGRLAQSVRAPL